MGYQTYHTIDVHEAPPHKVINEDFWNRVATMLSEISGYAEGEFDEWQGSLTVYGQWYDMSIHMKILSSLDEFLDVMFKVHGEGEENEDIWDYYVLNGRDAIYYATVTIPPLDPKDLS